MTDVVLRQGAANPADVILQAPGASSATATANLAEAADSIAGAVLVLVNGTAGLAEAGDALAAAGVVLVRGAATPAEAADTLIAAAGARVTATASLSDSESIAALGAVFVVASATEAEAADALSATAHVGDQQTVTADAALDEAADTLFAAAGEVRQGGMAVIPRRLRLMRPRAVIAALRESADTVVSTATVSRPARRRREDIELLLLAA